MWQASQGVSPPAARKSGNERQRAPTSASQRLVYFEFGKNGTHHVFFENLR